MNDCPADNGPLFLGCLRIAVIMNGTVTSQEQDVYDHLATSEETNGHGCPVLHPEKATDPKT